MLLPPSRRRGRANGDRPPSPGDGARSARRLTDVELEAAAGGYLPRGKRNPSDQGREY